MWWKDKGLKIFFFYIKQILGAHLEFHRVLWEVLVGHDGHMLAAPLEQRGEPGLVLCPALVHLLMMEERREKGGVNESSDLSEGNPILQIHRLIQIYRQMGFILQKVIYNKWLQHCSNNCIIIWKFQVIMHEAAQPASRKKGDNISAENKLNMLTGNAATIANVARVEHVLNLTCMLWSTLKLNKL